jgi:hypothetical protein
MGTEELLQALTRIRMLLAGIEHVSHWSSKTYSTAPLTAHGISSVIDHHVHVAIRPKPWATSTGF